MLRFACALLLWLLVSTSGATNAATALVDLKAQTLPVQSVGEVNQLSGRLMALANADVVTLGAKDFVLIADSYGNLVSRTRELGGSMKDFEDLLARAEALRERSRDKIRALESATNEDEIRLETLYRSDIWHDMNYAQSAFGYWQAWAALGIAHSKAGERDQVRWLSEADSGFRAASVRILYPGIVYGSWLGMGYVARARGDDALAEKRFRRLVQALVNDPDNPVRKIADGELTVLAIRRGEISPSVTLKDGPLSPSMSNVYLEEAFVLLQQHRNTGTGGVEAAIRLKKLIAEGHLDNRLATRILSYRDEIIGHDLGLFSLFVDAEYAYSNEQYDTAVLKYRKFERNGGLDLLINLTTLQYHYTVALLKIHQYHDALAEAEKLRRQSNLTPQVDAALPKLSFLVAQALYEQKGSNNNRARLLDAAEYFLASSADDPDIARAHMVLGQLSFNPKRAKYHTRQARRDPKLKGAIALSQLKKAITSFNGAEGGSSAQQQHADQVLMNLKNLPRHLRRKLWVRAVGLQMRTSLGRDLEQVLQDIEAIYTEAKTDPEIHLDANVKQVLLWSRLRALDKSGQQQALLGLVEVMAESGMDGFAQREVYRFLLEKERLEQFDELIALAQALYPGVDSQTQDQRQLRLLQIRAATATGANTEAYLMAKAMTGEFPGSGDAWIAYAETAEAVDEIFTAERAWAKITGAQPDGSPRWREAMAHRLRLMARLGGREDEFCTALRAAERYHHLATQPEQRALTEIKNQYPCES